MGNVDVGYEDGRGGADGDAHAYFTGLLSDADKAKGWYNQYKADHGAIIAEIFTPDPESVFESKESMEMWLNG